MTYSPESKMLLSWDEVNQCVILEGHGFEKPEMIKVILNKIPDLLKQKNSSKLIINMSQVAPYGREIEVWIQNDWYPRAVVAGLSNLAFVLPKNALAKMIMDKSRQNQPIPNLERTFFESLEAARQWLRSQ